MTYRDPHDPAKRRITRSGSGGELGDLHWHFNRNPAGQEDTRISAAKVHLDRALTLAGQGYFDAAERELGIGLHSLQDVFSHAQISPFNHSLLGDFPDFVRYSPVGMFEAALATEAYLKQFTVGLALQAPEPRAAARKRARNAAKLIGGDGTAPQKFEVAKILDRYPQGLVNLLKQHQVQIFVASPATKPTALGFGIDLDGDGRVNPGASRDINADGVQQPYEVEGVRGDGRKWDELVAGYHHGKRLVYLSAAALADPVRVDEILRHEIRHAVDNIFRDDPETGTRWRPTSTRFSMPPAAAAMSPLTSSIPRSSLPVVEPGRSTRSATHHDLEEGHGSAR